MELSGLERVSWLPVTLQEDIEWKATWNSRSCRHGCRWTGLEGGYQLADQKSAFLVCA
jgi:hypothetical protein